MNNNINGYFVKQENNRIKLLIEIIDKQYENLSSFYYELVLKINGGELDNRYYEIESVKEIFDIFVYLYRNFSGDVKKKKLDDITMDYLVKLMNMQTYKKGFDERLIKRLMYYEKDKMI